MKKIQEKIKLGDKSNKIFSSEQTCPNKVLLESGQGDLVIRPKRSPLSPSLP